ncbi:MAG: putative L-lysine-epsilon aminotransferase [Planctomycetota bacterium]|nr:MAG: putative L-lysine-epsilon aminotransferase [Planctomycetota bacterium]
MVPAAQVHDVLRRHILVDGLPLVLDYERSHGSWLVDKVSGRRYLDFFSFFASQPIGYNHPATQEADYERRLLQAAKLKPSSSDIYTEHYASFLQTFAEMGIRNDFRHAFFIAGGALAVENALKAAFDWKVQKNLAAGRGELGSRVIHFRHAFHGRSGYTLSLTNTADPRKYRWFPKFDWPRIDPPAMRFPVSPEAIAEVEAEERRALAAIEAAIARHPHDIAAIIVEPILAEGGDKHLRPEFFAGLRRLCDEHEVMLVFDEVQTGVGLTGSFWAWEQLGVKPDLLAFGKKMQVCGVLATERIDEIETNVFRVPSRINSTWGPDVTDMVRAERYLQIIRQEDLIANARRQGEVLRAGLEELCARHPGVLSAARGRGLMCAFDADTPARRDRIKEEAFARGLLLLGCGERSIRTRPFLDVRAEEIERFLEIVDEAVRASTG